MQNNERVVYGNLISSGNFLQYKDVIVQSIVRSFVRVLVHLYQERRKDICYFVGHTNCFLAVCIINHPRSLPLIGLAFIR